MDILIEQAKFLFDQGKKAGERNVILGGVVANQFPEMLENTDVDYTRDAYDYLPDEEK